jgi:hypothetical protein
VIQNAVIGDELRQGRVIFAPFAACRGEIDDPGYDAVGSAASVRNLKP